MCAIDLIMITCFAIFASASISICASELQIIDAKIPFWNYFTPNAFVQSFWLGWVVRSWPLFWALFVSFILGTAYSIDVSGFLYLIIYFQLRICQKNKSSMRILLATICTCWNFDLTYYLMAPKRKVWPGKEVKLPYQIYYHVDSNIHATFGWSFMLAYILR